MSDVKGALLWGAIALIVGFLLAAFLLHAPVKPVANPVYVPVAIATPTAAPTAPGATPTPTPLVKAAATTRTVVTITRPIYAPPRPREDRTAPAPTDGPGPDATYGPAWDPAATTETITIVTEADASAAAPVITPPPPVLVPVVVATPTPAAATWSDPLGGVGVTMGIFDGWMALDLEPIHWSPFGLVELGPSIILNQRMVGVGGSIALPTLSRHLYLEAGEGLRYADPWTPAPFIGFGVRL